MNNLLYGGIEAGGTKFVCCIADTAGTIAARIEIATGTVEQTMQQVFDFFNGGPKITSLGIGSFGPVNLDPLSSKFGCIMNTPKTGWQNTNIKSLLENALGVPTFIDTDVNCAARGEKHYGLAQQHDNFVYLTIGTGIGGGIMINGNIHRGLSHPEIGHMKIAHEAFTNGFIGNCPSHADCLEGIASGLSMQQRWGKKAEEISDPNAWALEAQYLGTAIANIALTLQPELFILGGGVMKHVGLLEMIHESVRRNINDYIELPPVESYIVHSTNIDNGILGAVSLASSN